MIFDEFMQSRLLNAGPGVVTLDWMIRAALVGRPDAQRMSIESLKELFDEALLEAYWYGYAS